MKIALRLFFLLFFTQYAFSQTLQVEARYNDSLSLSDYANGLTVDDEGNMYVTGQSYNSPVNSDIITIKYSPAGLPLWISRYDGAVNDADSGVAVAVDVEGNVFVTGTTGSGTNRNIVTIKYDSVGAQQWVKEFNGSGGSTDLPISIKLDVDENIYVAGQTTGSGFDYLLIKYSQAGGELWANTFDGSANSDDLLFGMKIDESSNIYVTGGSNESDGGENITTIKYDQSGSEQWVAQYDSLEEEGKSVDVDASGNVYITGFGSSVSFLSDYLTIKYDPSGVEQWVARYDGAAHKDDIACGIVVNSSGDCYVTGKSTGQATGVDFATIKYDSSGAMQWVSRFDSKKKKSDEPIGILMDAEENIYVAGATYFSFSTTPDFTTIKYQSSGTREWIARFKGYVGGVNKPMAFTLDSQFSVLVAGYSDGGNSKEDYLLLKYNQFNNNVWLFNDAGTTNHLYAIEAFDDLNAWAGGARGVIFHTSDGGFAWGKQNTPINMPDIRSISFPTVTTGYAVGNKGYILKTTDGGEAWVSLNTSGRNWTRYDLQRVHFYNEDSGYATGKGGTILTTTDGGGIWTVVTRKPVSKMNDIFFLDPYVGWAAGKKGALQKTYDGGINWEALENSSVNWSNLELTKSVFHDSMNGWAGGVKGALLNTTDGGTTWRDLTPTTVSGKPVVTTFCTQMRPIDSFAVAFSADKGALGFVSTRNGYSSVKSYVGFKQDLTDVIVKGSTVWAVGKVGIIVRSSTNILLAGSSRESMLTSHSITPVDFNLYQNYPNPFNPVTIINFYTGTKSIISLKVYDITGREVITLLNKQTYDIGDHEVTFDASSVSGGLSSGVYYYRMFLESSATQPKLTEIRRMLYIK